MHAHVCGRKSVLACWWSCLSSAAGLKSFVCVNMLPATQPAYTKARSCLQAPYQYVANTAAALKPPTHVHTQTSWWTVNDTLKRYVKQWVIVDCNIRHPEDITASHLGQQICLLLLRCWKRSMSHLLQIDKPTFSGHKILANPGTLAPHPRFLQKDRQSTAKWTKGRAPQAPATFVLSHTTRTSTFKQIEPALDNSKQQTCSASPSQAVVFVAPQ
jgi:hypothetical protein